MIYRLLDVSCGLEEDLNGGGEEVDDADEDRLVPVSPGLTWAAWKMPLNASRRPLPCPETQRARMKARYFSIVVSALRTGAGRRGLASRLPGIPEKPGAAPLGGAEGCRLADPAQKLLDPPRRSGLEIPGDEPGQRLKLLLRERLLRALERGPAGRLGREQGGLLPWRAQGTWIPNSRAMISFPFTLILLCRADLMPFSLKFTRNLDEPVFLQVAERGRLAGCDIKEDKIVLIFKSTDARKWKCLMYHQWFDCCSVIDACGASGYFQAVLEPGEKRRGGMSRLHAILSLISPLSSYVFPTGGARLAGRAGVPPGLRRAGNR